jgi:hypothetical protein
MTARFQKLVTPSPAATDTCGFILWAPNYHTQNLANNDMSVIIYSAPLTTTTPLNTTAVPYGSGAWGTTATTGALDDPCFAFTAGAVCDDARTIAACIKLVYTGKLQDASGMVVPLQGIPLSTVFNPGKGTYASVDDLFILGQNSRRLGVEEVEVVFRPGDPGQERFHEANYGPIKQGAAGTAATADAGDVETFIPTCFGFAWRGLQAQQAANFTIEMHKNVEWRPSADTGIPLTPNESVGPSFMERALRYLDTNYPGWWNKAVHSGVNTVARMAFAGNPAIRHNGI